MTAVPPLTEAEQAAARAIGGDFECTWHVGCDEECHADRARAVVAAVRSSIEAEARDAVAAEFDRLERAFAERQSWSAARSAKYGADVVRSLSLPASKETPK